MMGDSDECPGLIPHCGDRVRPHVHRVAAEPGPSDSASRAVMSDRIGDARCPFGVVHASCRPMEDVSCSSQSPGYPHGPGRSAASPSSWSRPCQERYSYSRNTATSGPSEASFRSRRPRPVVRTSAASLEVHRRRSASVVRAAMMTTTMIVAPATTGHASVGSHSLTASTERGLRRRELHCRSCPQQQTTRRLADPEADRIAHPCRDRG